MGGMEGWLPIVLAVVAVVVVLVVVDRLTAAGMFDRRGDRPRERRPGGGGGAGALGTMLDFYDPSHRHLTEEQQREKSTTVQVPGEAPPLIDLDAGTAVIETDGDRHAPDAQCPTRTRPTPARPTPNARRPHARRSRPRRRPPDPRGLTRAQPLGSSVIHTAVAPECPASTTTVIVPTATTTASAAATTR